MKLCNTLSIRTLVSSALILIFCLYGCAGYVYEGTQTAAAIRAQIKTRQEVQRIKLMAGTAYQTSVFIFDSEIPGPAVLIIGGTHGDEPAGYEAALRLVDRFFNEKIKKGKLFILPEANRISVHNYQRRVRVSYGWHPEKGNLNRCYPGSAGGLPMEQLAKQIQDLVVENNISVLIDLHEALNFHLDIEESAEKKGLGQTIIYYPNEASTWIVMNLLSEINKDISDNRQKFSALEQPIDNSASWWAGKYLDIAGFTFETARKNPLDLRIEYHLKLVEIALRTEGLL